jgi:phenol 2-monooxygenase
LTSPDLLNPIGVSAKSLDAVDEILGSYHPSMIQLSVLHSLDEQIRGKDWNELPPMIKKRAEMRFHSARPGETPAGPVGIRKENALSADDVYGIFGVDRQKGAIVVLRPDGYVGSISALDDTRRVAEYIDTLLVRWVV